MNRNILTRKTHIDDITKGFIINIDSTWRALKVEEPVKVNSFPPSNTGC